MTLTVLVICGCTAAGEAVDKGGNLAKDIFKRVDPTGALDEIDERKEAAAKVGEKANELDVVTFNETVGELKNLVGAIAERVNATPPDALTALQKELLDLLTALRTKLETERATAAVANAAEALNDKIKALDVEEIDAAAQSLRLSLQVATGVLVLIGACATVWLVGVFRGRAGPSTSGNNT